MAIHPHEILHNLADEVRRGNLSRRAFMRVASWLGVGAAGAYLVLGASPSLEADELSATLKQANEEIDQLLKELHEAVDEYNRKVDEMDEEDDEPLNDQGDEDVYIRLTYPAGKSPKVFQTGWMFGGECLIRPENEDDDPIDRSGELEWGGTASFSPQKGGTSRPSFNGTGSNTIVLSIQHKGRTITKTTRLDVVSSERYAAVGTMVRCEADSHGCPGCPHTVTGPIATGSPQVMIGGHPAARMGDGGIHSACCGPNTFNIAEGDSDVLINGRPAAFHGAKTIHCGGIGKVQ